jgi:hypothetical protein
VSIFRLETMLQTSPPNSLLHSLLWREKKKKNIVAARCQSWLDTLAGVEMHVGRDVLQLRRLERRGPIKNSRWRASAPREAAISG